MIKEFKEEFETEVFGIEVFEVEEFGIEMFEAEEFGVVLGVKTRGYATLTLSVQLLLLGLIVLLHEHVLFQILNSVSQ
ncbi:8127_t:CDS:2 [Funneliformis mosseae]|uniref:8127_t:CDS:1 n=1 Tax=Funneliformis mosseae TaxID=27381 RepID=A0A9N9DI53_FUNMO|nr:8127_t:CDS:2 [Funneliformis mosseae]